MSGVPSLTIRRRLDAEPARVFDAWTDPARLARWFGPARVASARAEVDARPGGRYSIVLRTTDGEEHEVGGVYREVVANEKLVFTWAWRATPERESLVTVALRPDGAGTMLTLTHAHLHDDATRERHEAGWTGTLDKLERYLA